MPFRRTSPPHWQQPSSQNEIETASRITRLEERLDAKRFLLESIETEQQRMKDQLTLHERAILAIAGALFLALQDKFPAVAAALKAVLK